MIIAISEYDPAKVRQHKPISQQVIEEEEEEDDDEGDIFSQFTMKKPAPKKKVQKKVEEEAPIIRKHALYLKMIVFEENEQ